MWKLSIAPFAFLFAATVGAQDPTPTGLLIPVDSSLVIHLQGPAAIRRIHGQDPYGVWMQSPAVQQAWKDVCKALAPQLEALARSLPADSPWTPEQCKSLPDLVAKFDGAITLGVWIDAAMKLDSYNFDPDQACAILQIEPGSQDLTSLTADLGKVFDREMENSKPLQLPGITTALGSHRTAPEIQVSRPFRYRGRLCLAAGGDVEAFLRKGLSDEARHGELVATQKQSSFHAQVDFRNLRSIVARQRAVTNPGGTTAWVVLMDDICGISSLDRAQVRSYSKDGRSIYDVSVRWDSDPPEGLAILLPKPGQVSKLQGFAPYRLMETSFGCIDLGKAVRWTFKLIDKARSMASEAETPPTLAQVEEMFVDKTGIRLFEDLFDHTGTDLMVVEHIRVPDLEEEEFALDEQLARFQTRFEDSCYCLSLRDGEAFAKSLERTLRKFALHTSRKRKEYKGQKVYTLKNPLLGGIEVHYAVHPRCFLIALGKGGLNCLHAVVDEIVDRAAGKPPQVPEAIRKALETQPAGSYAVGHINFRELVAVLAEVTTLFGGENGGGWDEIMPDLAEGAGRKLIGQLTKAFFEVAQALPPTPAYATKTMRYQDRTLLLREIW